MPERASATGSWAMNDKFRQYFFVTDSTVEPQVLWRVTHTNGKYFEQLKDILSRRGVSTFSVREIRITGLTARDLSLTVDRK